MVVEQQAQRTFFLVSSVKSSKKRPPQRPSNVYFQPRILDSSKSCVSAHIISSPFLSLSLSLSLTENQTISQFSLGILRSACDQTVS
ncbi:hypothetical protein L1987_31074 [Smallanthus sonchifolius]|uniref:Uncharacterized protein n=1 Tax=Smallanthus sonchifolius TaxID=185202 RepID=A0ACB9I4D0_9ASTR|nr:hypothetical protein L1987_31074 [Smallanthus sonchifolius]